MTLSPDDDAAIPDFVPEDLLSDSAPVEASAEARAAEAARIAKANDRLRDAGQISDGSGKPVYRKAVKAVPWIVIGALVATGIVAFVLLFG